MRFATVIAGTHGKTTTAMISGIYGRGGLDPTFVSSGLVKAAGVHASRLKPLPDCGSGRKRCLFPAFTADGGRGHQYRAGITWILITVILKTTKDTFVNFLHNLPFYGLAVVCMDDAVIREIVPRIGRYVITYGFHEDADVRITDFEQRGSQCFFTVHGENLPDRLWN